MGIGAIIRRRKRKRIRKRQRAARKAAGKIHIEDQLRKTFPELVVANGPFEGMIYPELRSVGSVLFPKLLGSYESELGEILQQALETDYSEIVDIGCAEGYYAIGLGLRFPKAKIYAFDIDREALRLCRAMATLNGISEERLVLGAFCDPEALLSLPLSRRALIVCDCEGYEKQLFTPEAPERLRQHDLLVETHDFLDIEISTYLHDLFSPTHDVQVVQSIDDIQKAKTYEYDQIADCDLEQRFALLAEGRPAIMEWISIRSRRIAGGNG